MAIVADKLPCTWRGLILIVVLALSPLHSAFADNRVSDFMVDPDPRGAPDLTICTQNFENYGLLPDVKKREPGMDQDGYSTKQQALISRFITARCDIIAAQEILGTKEDAYQALISLRDQMRGRWNRFFNVVNGDGEDGSRCAFLYAIDKVELLNSVTYKGVELPRLAPEDAARSFPRAPLELQVRTIAGVGSSPKTVNLITFHFKSKRGGWKDPAELEYETSRMAMSEAIRRIVLARHRETLSSGEAPLLLLGDRNSDADSASARILEGSIRLANFMKDKQCRIGARGVPLCLPTARGKQDFFSVLTQDPETKALEGSYTYQNEKIWLDEILMSAASLHYARTKLENSGNYHSGLVEEPKEASDHALAYVRLNW